tara:strand:+ start:170 stop:1066 length:897 start_codon:yes stop_codon:yes gene_type:complete
MIIFLFKKKYIRNYIFLFIILLVNAVPFFLQEQCHSRLTRFNAIEIIKLSSIQNDKLKLTNKKQINYSDKKIKFTKKNTSNNYQIREDLIKSIFNKNEKQFRKIRDLILLNCEDKDFIGRDICKKQTKEKEEIIKKIMNRERNYETTNITVEVYKNAFYVMISVLLNQPLGYGINNYKDAFDYYTPLNYLESNISENKYFRQPVPWEVLTLNRSDGRSNLIKLISEFGYFGIFLLLFFVMCSLTKKISISEKSFFIPLLITQLISGAGYFNGGFIIIICLMSASFLKIEKNNKQNSEN